jgi:hypothetical protein
LRRLTSTVKQGLVSLIAETGQAASPHDIATILGFGASAICPISVHNRVISHYSVEQQQKILDTYQSRRKITHENHENSANVLRKLYRQ